jgi:hypothetical protein
MLSCRQVNRTTKGKATAVPSCDSKAMPGLRQLVFSSLLRTVTYPQDSAMNSNTNCTTDSIAHDASFTFWFPLAWTLVGVLFTICACLLAFYITFRRRDPLTTRLDHILDVRIIGESGGLRVVRDDVAELRKALSAPWQSLAETTGFQALASEVRETCGAVTEFMTEEREPACMSLIVCVVLLLQEPILTCGRCDSLAVDDIIVVDLQSDLDNSSHHNTTQTVSTFVHKILYRRSLCLAVTPSHSLLVRPSACIFPTLSHRTDATSQEQTSMLMHTIRLLSWCR